MRKGRLRGSRDTAELGVASRLVADLVAERFQAALEQHAKGRLLDLGCGKVPLYGTYRPYVTEIVCVDWNVGTHVDRACDLSEPLPFEAGQFDTIILSDVLEHLPDPKLLWSEMARILAKDGKILISVPFLYWIHEHPHDYYRYTSFALQRFARESGLTLLTLDAVGGAVEVIADVLGKVTFKLPVVGHPTAAGLQSVARAVGKTSLGKRLVRATENHLPIGYFLVAHKAA